MARIDCVEFPAEALLRAVGMRIRRRVNGGLALLIVSVVGGRWSSDMPERGMQYGPL